MSESYRKHADLPHYRAVTKFEESWLESIVGLEENTVYYESSTLDATSGLVDYYYTVPITRAEFASALTRAISVATPRNRSIL